MKLLWTLILASRAEWDEDCAPNEKICERVENEPEKVEQICGSDGNTYSNQCVFKHYKCVTGVVVQKVGEGACSGNETNLMNSINIAQLEKKHLCPVQCNKSRGSKVCASDGKTYNNECAVFQKQCEGENVFFEHFGSCCENDDCSGYEGEEMLMDALEFEENENEEADEQKAIAAAYAGIARERTECLRGCTLNLLPVCGTDGNSYPNSCVLTERKCSSSPDLQILHHGFCHRTVHNDDYDEYMQQKDPNWNNDLPDYDSPLFRVNDINVLTVNVDYENEFENDQLFLFDAALESSEYDEEEEIETTTDLQTTQASTIAAATQNPKCVDAYPKFIDGKFEKCPSSKENYKPVCGSDVITYFNECHFTSTICFTPEKSEIEIVHEGVCKSDPFHAFHEALESKRKTQTGTGLDRSGGDARRIKMEKAKARREKRLQHRQNRKNGIKKQIIVSARSNTVNQDENTDEVKSEKQLSRYEKRVAWRRQRKNNKKPTSSTPMLFDVGVPAEPLNELDEKFPDLCSEIDCEDFAEPSAAICGRVKNMSEKELTGKIWSFRSRCFFKRKRCHLIKKSQQIFAAQIRKQKNSLEKSGKEEDAKKIKFNKSGSRLKRVNCDTGELFQKNETPEKPEEDFSESEFENY